MASYADFMKSSADKTTSFFNTPLVPRVVVAWLSPKETDSFVNKTISPVNETFFPGVSPGVYKATFMALTLKGCEARSVQT